MSEHERLERGSGDDRAVQLALRHDVGDGQLAEKHGDLAEELASSERAVVLSVHAYHGFARGMM